MLTLVVLLLFFCNRAGKLGFLLWFILVVVVAVRILVIDPSKSELQGTVSGSESDGSSVPDRIGQDASKIWERVKENWVDFWGALVRSFLKLMNEVKQLWCKYPAHCIAALVCVIVFGFIMRISGAGILNSTALLLVMFVVFGSLFSRFTSEVITKETIPFTLNLGLFLVLGYALSWFTIYQINQVAKRYSDQVVADLQEDENSRLLSRKLTMPRKVMV